MAELTRKALDGLIAARLAEDPTFRERLRANPRRELSELTGVPVPDVVAITVHEESVAEIHIVVPVEAAELSDEDLSLVSGGWSPPPVGYPSRNCGP